MVYSKLSRYLKNFMKRLVVDEYNTRMHMHQCNNIKGFSLTFCIKYNLAECLFWKVLFILISDYMWIKEYNQWIQSPGDCTFITAFKVLLFICQFITLCRSTRDDLCLNLSWVSLVYSWRWLHRAVLCIKRKKNMPHAWKEHPFMLNGHKCWAFNGSIGQIVRSGTFYSKQSEIK